MLEDHLLDSSFDAINIMIHIEYVGIKIWELSLWLVCFEEYDIVIPSRSSSRHHLNRRKKRRIGVEKSSSRWTFSKRSFAWCLWSACWKWSCEDMPKRGFPIMEYGGAICESSSSKLDQETRSILRWSRSSSSSSSGMRDEKVSSLNPLWIMSIFYMCYLANPSVVI